MGLGGVLPRGQQDFNTIRKKLTDDIAVARKYEPAGIAFVTNQELRLAERRDLRALGGDIDVDVFHLERVATILARPRMAAIRQRYLKIAVGRPPMIVEASIAGTAVAFTEEDAVVDLLVDLHKNQLRERSEEARQAPTGVPRLLAGPAVAGLYASMGRQAPEPPKALSDNEIHEEVQKFRQSLESDWSWSREYLVGAARLSVGRFWVYLTVVHGGWVSGRHRRGRSYL